MIGLVFPYKPQTTVLEKQIAAIELIKSEEGFIWYAKKDSDGKYRIGYSTPSYQGARISKMLAEIALHNYLKKEVFPYVPDSFSVNQYAVYSSLIYNFGRTGAKQFIVNKSIDCKRILVYNKSIQKNRRQREYELCVK